MQIRHSLLSALAFMAFLLPSCSNDDESVNLRRPTALVTVCPESDGSFFMQLDNTTRLMPVNVKTSPFGEKEVRALVNYSEVDGNTPDGNLRNVKVNWIDSIRTKLPVENLGDRNDEVYGKDPVEIVRDWVTIAEDGYLTLRIRTIWGMPTSRHYINLLTGSNPSDPFELELRHDAKNDIVGTWGDALIAFNLNKLPRTEGDDVRIKLKWHSFEGDKSAEFDLKLRKLPQDIDAASIKFSGAVD